LRSGAIETLASIFNIWEVQSSNISQNSSNAVWRWNYSLQY